MRKLSLLTFIMLTLVCVSCEDDIETPKDLTLETKHYLPLEVGNYWVYDVYEINDGVEKKKNKQDTVKISSEFNIEGNKYYEVQTHDYQSKWRELFTVKDSLGYLVSPRGYKIFSNILFDTVIREHHTTSPYGDILSSEYYRMRKIEKPITTAVGTFSVLDLENDVIVPGDRYNKKVHCYFAKDIGIVFKTYTYITTPSTYWIEQRLVEYCINGKKYPER